MKKILMIMFTVLTAVTMQAQHGAMKFSGISTMTVLTSTTESQSDTIVFQMQGMTSGNITLPEMKGMGVIPSFTINNVSFSLGADHKVTFPEQTFSSSVVVDGVEKTITGSKLSGSYDMQNNLLSLAVEFKYGTMPFAMNYTIDSYYIKDVTSAINVVVGGVYSYKNASVTYKVRKYQANGEELLDVEIPTFKLDNTIIGNLTLGHYIVSGLQWNEDMQGYYRDYRNDNLTFHFTAERGGTTSMDDDYTFNPEKDNNILVKYEGNKVVDIVNKFQMGSMPFPIVSSFDNEASSVEAVQLHTNKECQSVYNLSGQVVGSNYKGIVIKNGKKYIVK